MGRIAFVLAAGLASGCTDGRVAAGDGGAPCAPGGCPDLALVADPDLGERGACPPGSLGTEIVSLPPCALGDGPIDVPRGCTPVVDGTLHAEEWGDAACMRLSGDISVEIKHDAAAVYLAVAGPPTCDCAMPFYFDPDGQPVLDGDEYAVSVYDEPLKRDGDRADYVFRNGALVAGAAPDGIVTRCPGSQPNPIRYEWRIPYTALGIAAGVPHQFHFAIVHADVRWPGTLTVDAQGVALHPADWATIRSSGNWQ